jgi:hypothetical protein
MKRQIVIVACNAAMVGLLIASLVGFIVHQL